MAKKQIDPNDTLAQDAISQRVKVLTEFSPYFAKENQIEVTTIEQINFYHKKVGGSRVLGEYIKDKNVSKWRKKRVIKDLIKFWDREFQSQIGTQRNNIIDKATNLSRRRIKRIHFTFVFLAIIIFTISIFVTKQPSYLLRIPFLGGTIGKFYDMMDNHLYYNLTIVLSYLSFVTILYKIWIRTYFDNLRQVGTNSEAYINTEFRKINANFYIQQKKIKKHLLKARSKYYKKTYQINRIFDPNVIINKLEEYSTHIESKVTKFRKKYYWLLLVHFLLKLSVLGMAGFIGYNFYNNFM